MIRNALFLLGLFACLSTAAQRDSSFAGPRERWVFGAALTWLPVEPGLFATVPPVSHELALHLNLARGIGHRWRLGAELLPLWISDPGRGQRFDRYWAYGLFGQFDMTARERARVYLESGLYNSDVCFCGDFRPFRRPGMRYLSLGLGLDYPLSRRLMLDLAFLTYEPISPQPGRYNWTQYIFGLDLLLGKVGE